MAIKILYDYVYIYDTKDDEYPETRYVYFYDLSDNTIFRTNDEDCLERFMTRSIGIRGHLEYVLEPTDTMLAGFILMNMLLPLAIWTISLRITDSDNLSLFIHYLSSLLGLIINYLLIVKSKTEQMKRLKANSKIFQVSKKDTGQEQPMLISEVNELIAKRKRKTEIFTHYLKIVLCLFCAYFLPVMFTLPFITSLEILPHNYLRLNRHLKKIEIED